MDYSVCFVVLCNKNNAKTGFIRIVSQDYFKPDSKTDTKRRSESQKYLDWGNYCRSSGQNPAQRMTNINQFAQDFTQ